MRASFLVHSQPRSLSLKSQSIAMAQGNSSGGSGSHSQLITVEDLMRSNPYPTLILRSNRTTEATAGPQNQDQERQQFSQFRSLMRETEEATNGLIEGIQSLGKTKEAKKKQSAVDNYLKMREEGKKKFLKYLDEQNEKGRQAMEQMTVEQMKEFMEFMDLRDQFILDLLDWIEKFCKTMAQLILSGNTPDPAVIKEFFARATQARDSAVPSFAFPDSDDLPKESSTEGKDH